LSLVKPAKPRATLSETPHGLEIVIPARRNWLLIVFVAAWLCGWAVGEIMVPLSLFSETGDPSAVAFAVVWFAMWTLGGGFALYVFLWSLVGRERVLLSASRLAFKRDLLGFGRLREYPPCQCRERHLPGAI
jgi:hypothetical protein